MPALQGVALRWRLLVALAGLGAAHITTAGTAKSEAGSIPPWELRGILYRGGQAGLALLARAGEAERCVGRGGEFAPGWRLVTLAERSVEIQGGGRRWALELAGAARPTGLSSLPVESLGAVGAGAVGGKGYVDDRRALPGARRWLKALREKSKAELLALGAEVELEFASGRDGRPGLRVYTEAQAPALSSLGLQAGDLVRAVNGQAVGSVEELARRLPRWLSEAGDFELDVERNGTPVRIRLQAER